MKIKEKGASPPDNTEDTMQYEERIEETSSRNGQYSGMRAGSGV